MVMVKIFVCEWVQPVIYLTAKVANKLRRHKFLTFVTNYHRVRPLIILR